MARKKLEASMFAQHIERSAAVRKSMVAHVKKHVKSDEASVFLSAGVDSHACLFAALEAGKKVTTYSFTLDDRESTDFKVARQTAETFGLKFVPVKLKTDLDSIKKYLLRLYKYSEELDIHINKSSAECLYPLFETYDKVFKANSQASILGLGGDIFFCTTRKQRKQLIAGEYEQGKENYLKNIVLVNNGSVQLRLLDHHIASSKVPTHKIVNPFHDARMFDIFRNMHPELQGGKPIQKAPVRFAFFDQFQQCGVRVHQSFQKGDSGISDHFSKILLASDWNTRGLKSVVGIYNDLEVGALPPKPQYRKTLFGSTKQIP